MLFSLKAFQSCIKNIFIFLTSHSCSFVDHPCFAKKEATSQKLRCRTKMAKSETFPQSQGRSVSQEITKTKWIFCCAPLLFNFRQTEVRGFFMGRKLRWLFRQQSSLTIHFHATFQIISEIFSIECAVLFHSNGMWRNGNFLEN